MTDMLKLLKIVDKVEKPVMINEAVSLNISANGDCPDDITSILGKLVNLSNPTPVTDKMMPHGNHHDTMMKTIADVGGYADEAGHAYADEVGEEWANEPDPEVSDVEYMTKDLAGGLNKPKKQFKKEYPGDNPMTMEESLASKLMSEYKDLIENDSKIVHCSQCGKGFSSAGVDAKYKTGFSHCKDHKGMKVAVSEASAEKLNRYRDLAASSDTSKMNPNKAFARNTKYPALAGAKIAAGKDDEDSKYALNRYKMSGGKVNVPATEALGGSTIKHKQKLSHMTDKEFADHPHYAKMSDDDLRSMAWRHGHGKPGTPGHDHYVNRRNKGKTTDEDWEAGTSPKGSNERKRKAVQMALGRRHKDDPEFLDRMNPKTASLIHGRRLQKQGINKESHFAESKDKKPTDDAKKKKADKMKAYRADRDKHGED